MIKWIKKVSGGLYGDFHAWRRKEKRVAPMGTTGRIYAKRDGTPKDPDGGNHVKKRVKPKLVLKMKVTRAADGSVEHFEAPVQLKAGKQ